MDQPASGTARDFGNMLNQKAVSKKPKKEAKGSPWLKMGSKGGC